MCEIKCYIIQMHSFENAALYRIELQTHDCVTKEFHLFHVLFEKLVNFFSKVRILCCLQAVNIGLAQFSNCSFCSQKSISGIFLKYFFFLFLIQNLIAGTGKNKGNL